MPEQRLQLQHSTPGARISVSSTRAAYFGPGLRLSPHRNATATLALSPLEPFELERLDADAPEPRVSRTRAALIPPGARHHLRASGPLAFVYLDPLGDDFARLAALDVTAAAACLPSAHGAAWWTWSVDELCAHLGVPARGAPDERIARVVRLVDERPQAFTHLRDAARLAGWSSSHFGEVFRQSVGVPFRRYRLWRRMAVVLRVVSAGGTLTAAAFEAGFASSAHLSAAFRAMFGLTPSALVALGASIEFTNADDRTPCLSDGTRPRARSTP